jgi:hypothetical protein
MDVSVGNTQPFHRDPNLVWLKRASYYSCNRAHTIEQGSVCALIEIVHAGDVGTWNHDQVAFHYRMKDEKRDESLVTPDNLGRRTTSDYFTEDAAYCHLCLSPL